jgi:hypothetical protein
MNPKANRIAILPVNGMPKFDVANAAAEWLLLSVVLPMRLESCKVAFATVFCDVA